MKERIRELQIISDNRLNEINEYTGQRENLLKEIQKLRESRDSFNENQVMSSRNYLLLENSMQGLKEDYKAMQESYNNKLQLEKEIRDATQTELQVTKVIIYIVIEKYIFF